MRYNNRVQFLAAVPAHMALRPVVVCIAILLGSTGASALTLGNVRGSVLVGKPVNVTVPVTLDGVDPANATCTEVEISFADARLDSGRVKTSWVAPDAKGEGQLRIQSTVAVDEPMISILLRAGCVRKLERRYVLLADVATEPVVFTALPADSLPVVRSSAIPMEPPAVAKVNPSPLIGESSLPAAAPVVPKTTPPNVSAAKIRPTPVLSEAAATKAPLRPERAVVPALTVATAVTTVASAPLAVVSTPSVVFKESFKKAPLPDSNKLATSPLKPKDDPVSAKPRLRLEPLPEFSPVLKSSLSLLAVPTEDLQAREKARALWRVLNVSPDQLLSELQRVQALEAQAKSMQASKAQDLAAQADLKAQLEKAEEDRYSNWLVGLLGALALGASSIAGFLWWRSKPQAGWSPKDMWHGHSVEPSNLSDLAPADSAMPEYGALSKSSRFSKRSKKSIQPDVDLGVDESLFDSLKAVSVQPLSSQMDSGAASGGRPYLHSLRTVNVEELFDIQQQAEFFVSLGQYEQAIELLRQHIDTNTSTSGIAYLDLLKIYHQLDRRNEYAQLRDEFNRSFNAKVPTFDKFGEMQRRGLTRYPSAMARIETLWKSPRILSVLQEAIFRRPDVDDAECFDLEAYRDLLLLFSVAKEVSGVSSGVTTTGHSHRPDQAGSRSAQALDSVGAPQTVVQSRFNASQDAFDSVAQAAQASLGQGLSPAAASHAGVDVNLFDLESSHGGLDELAAGDQQPAGSLAAPQDVFLPKAKAAVVTMSAALEPLPGSETALPPLDFSLSLPPEFSTPGVEQPVPMKPETGMAPLDFELDK